MVRIKHRYLLLNVLYPAEQEINPHKPSNSDKPTNSIANKKSTTSSSSTQNKSSQNKTKDPDDLPWTVQFRRPSADSFNAKLLAKVIRDGVEELFGEYGAGMIGASFQVKYISPSTSTAIIRVSRSHYRLIWAALSFITKLPAPKPLENNTNQHSNSTQNNYSNQNTGPKDRPCVIQVIRVSGTIKKAEEEAIRRARGVIGRVRRGEERVRRGGMGKRSGIGGVGEIGDGGGDDGVSGFGGGIESDDGDGEDD